MFSEKFEKKAEDIFEKGLKKLEAPITTLPISDTKILSLPNSVILEMLEKTKKIEEKNKGDQSFIFALEIDQRDMPKYTEALKNNPQKIVKQKEDWYDSNSLFAETP